MKLCTLMLFAIAGLFTRAQGQIQIGNEKQIEMLLDKIRSKTITADERKELNTMAYDIQNKGQLFDEHDHDYKSSLAYTGKAIVLFNALEDSLNVANNKKFRGYLLGRFGRFTEAKAEIADAINLFQLKNRDWGVVVSQFDLARVYEFENKIDSAVYYTDISVSFWKSRKNNSRVLISNTMLINLLIKLRQLEKAKTIQKESEILAADPELHWQNAIDFYFVSMQLYIAANDTNTTSRYQKLYTEKIADLKNKRITGSPYYESISK